MQCLKGVTFSKAHHLGHLKHIPYAPCMEYLPTFTINLGQMQVNIPYMEHLGIMLRIFRLSFLQVSCEERNGWGQLQRHRPN